MATDTTTSDDANLFPGAAWFDPNEAGIRGQLRGLIGGLIGGSSRRPRRGANVTNAARVHHSRGGCALRHARGR